MTTDKIHVINNKLEPTARWTVKTLHEYTATIFYCVTELLYG